mmetsp:Transcript_85950/g.171627  ORF Transcript_85950/g.171627 Transcript_85950/m.171627 type:complete len:284 (-) Transcript_85950:256-1107(-)
MGRGTPTYSARVEKTRSRHVHATIAVKLARMPRLGPKRHPAPRCAPVCHCRARHVWRLLLIVVVSVVVVVVIVSIRQDCSLLGPDGSLALLVGALGLGVDGFVRIFLLGRLVLRVLTNLFVRLLVKILETVALEFFLNVLGELRLVALRILLLKQLHVLRNVAAKNVLFVRLSIVLLAFPVVARETLLRVRDVEAAVNCALERAEDAVAGRSAHETHVQHAREGALLPLLLHKEHLTIRLRLALVRVRHIELGKQPARAQEPRGVARRVVCEPHLDAVPRQLM